MCVVGQNDGIKCIKIILLIKYDVIFMPVRELEREEKSKKNMKLPIPVTSGLVDKVSKNNRDLRVNGSLIDNLQTLVVICNSSTFTM